MDSSSNWLWAKQAGGTIWDTGYSIAIDDNGNNILQVFLPSATFFLH